MGNYNRITFKERVRIEAGIYAQKSFSQIAKDLGRSTSSIVGRSNKTEQSLNLRIHLVEIAFVSALVGKETFVEKRIVLFCAGCVLNTDVQNIALIGCRLVAKRQKSHLLSVMPVQKSKIKAASITSTITWRKRQRQMQRKLGQSPERGSGLVRRNCEGLMRCCRR